MVRGKHVPGLAGVNEFHIDSPLQREVLDASQAALNGQEPKVI